jgi:D-alanine--poly(phosphoribitol) ligase subunit 1
MDPRASDGTCSLAAAIYRHGRVTPEATAVCAEGRSLTYRQLADHAAHLAGRLRAAPGWETGSAAKVRGERAPARVAILASRSVDACVAVVGTAWAGATYVPLGVSLPDERLLAMLSACNPLAIVADGVGAARLTGRVLQAAPPCLLALAREPPPAVEPARIEWLDTAASSPQGGELAAPAPRSMSCLRPDPWVPSSSRERTG